MPRPRVSVIIPTYNCDRFLAEAIDSVLAQTYGDYELIVVDDGSTDNTEQILRRYGQRLRIQHQYNQGVVAARNQGIQLAQGEWLTFLDADDFFEPTKLEDQMAMVAAQPKLGLVHSGWRLVTAERTPVKTIEPWQRTPELKIEGWLQTPLALASAMLFRREWLEQAGGFDPRFPASGDMDLALRLALMGCEADWLRQVTVNYRQHTATHRGIPQAKALTAVIEKFFAQPNLPESVRWIEKRVRYDTLVWVAWYLYDTGYLAEMADYLQRAWMYSPYAPVATWVNWGDRFAALAKDWGSRFDAEALASTPEWQALAQWVVAKL